MSDTAFNAIARHHMGMARLIEEKPVLADILYDAVNLMYQFADRKQIPAEELDVSTFMNIQGGNASIVISVRRLDLNWLGEQLEKDTTEED